MLLLALHPHFTLYAIGGSEISAGQSYKDAAKWKQSLRIPKAYAEMVVKPCEPEYFKDYDFVFSDSRVAGNTGISQLHFPKRMMGLS